MYNYFACYIRRYTTLASRYRSNFGCGAGHGGDCPSVGYDSCYVLCASFDISLSSVVLHEVWGAGAEILFMMEVGKRA